MATGFMPAWYDALMWFALPVSISAAAAFAGDKVCGAPFHHDHAGLHLCEQCDEAGGGRVGLGTVSEDADRERSSGDAIDGA